MDLLNDYHPLYEENPYASTDTEDEKYIEKLDSINNNRKRKKNLTFDDYCIKYSDELWHLWSIIDDFKKNSNLLNRLDYACFCSVCYENSTKY